MGEPGAEIQRVGEPKGASKEVAVKGSMSAEGFRFTTNPSEQEHILPSVALGRMPGAGYNDRAEIPVEGTGFDVRVWQTSYGSTGVETSAHEGFRVNALGLDPETRLPVWKSPIHDEYVRVGEDQGNLQGASMQQIREGNMGNPGFRTGVIRVTEEATGQETYYAVGAKFDGRQDAWNVSPAYIKVEPVPTALPGESTPPTPILPPSV